MKHSRRILITMAAIAALLIPGPGGLCAQNQPPAKPLRPRYTLATANYNFLIASGFLCELGGSCRAVAQDAQENPIEISGAGTLRLADHSVTGAGSFSEETRNGAIVSTGVWTATKLVSFKPYGIAPLELQRKYPELRTVSIFAMRHPTPPNPLVPLPMAQPLAAGGLAVIRIRMMPDAGPAQDAVLQINCAKGKAPQYHQVDGVKLSVAGGPSFDEQVSGRTLFLLLGPTPKPARRSISSQR